MNFTGFYRFNLPEQLGYIVHLKMTSFIIYIALFHTMEVSEDFHNQTTKKAL